MFNKLPNNLKIKQLTNPIKNSKLLLIGVEDNNLKHTEFLYDLINKYTPSLVTTELYPDHPVFIKTKLSFEIAWLKFVNDNYKKYKFYVKPYPNCISDIIMNKEKIDVFFKLTISNDLKNFEIFDKIIFSNKLISYDKTPGAIESGSKMSPNINLTPFLTIHNGNYEDKSVAITGYPLLLKYINIAKAFSVSDLRFLYNNFTNNLSFNTLNLIKSEEDVFPDELITEIDKYKFQNKNVFYKFDIEYYSKLITLIQTFSDKAFFTVNHNIFNDILSAWKYGSEGDNNCFNFSQEYKQREKINDFIEKLVIIDFFNYEKVYNSYVKYNKFPFKLDFLNDLDFIRDHYFVLWRHFKSTYSRHPDADDTLDIEA